MGDTDYDRGWDIGYEGGIRTPPPGVDNATEWYEGWDDGREYADSQDEDRWHAAMWCD